MVSVVGSLLIEHVFLCSVSAHGHTLVHIHFPSLLECHFNPLFSWNSHGFKEQKSCRHSGNIIIIMVKNKEKYLRMLNLFPLMCANLSLGPLCLGKELSAVKEIFNCQKFFFVSAFKSCINYQK